ncbi:MAG: hypothetical protein HYR73_01650, partial [Candidatus Eisenbacteria bacterium]|nr:hypothetical protein [Candidatus Eisenbacteria bacterium]
AAATIALVAMPALAAHASHGDSGRMVHRVVISNDGVRIEGGSGDSTIVEGSDAGKNGDISFDVDGHRHHVRVGHGQVEVDGDQGGVRVNGPVMTVGARDNSVVRVFADADVPAGEHIDGDVVAVFGSVHVAGQVNGSTVAVFGSVTLDSTAKIDGDAVSIGGALDAAPGSTVSGERVSLGFLPLTWGLPALPILLGLVLVGWLISLFMGWMLQLLFADRMLRAAVTCSRRTGISFLLGVASAPLMVIACVLLLITVIGIPVALLLPIAYGLLTWAGQLAATYLLGCKILRRVPGEGGSFAPLAVGLLFIAGFFATAAAFASGSGVFRTGTLFFLALGSLLSTGLAVIGTGAFLVSHFGARPADVFAHPRVGGTDAAAPAGAATPPIT